MTRGATTATDRYGRSVGVAISSEQPVLIMHEGVLMAAYPVDGKQTRCVGYSREAEAKQRAEWATLDADTLTTIATAK